MRAFARQPAPDFWGVYELRWLRETLGPTVDPLRWVREKRTLAAWFHARVRPEGEARRCAYCDGPLGPQSPETVDHFVPAHACRELAMSWDNLYPACTTCNSTFKGARWSCAVARPDVDPVEAWFDFDEVTGRLEAAPGLDRRIRARVRLTLRLFGLNTTERCADCRRFFRMLENARGNGDEEYVDEALTQGPYRFVARKFVLSLRARTSAATPRK